MSSDGIPIIVPTQNHTFKLNKDALAQLLMQENIKDRCVCIVSVAGAFRTGKSFLLDFFIRYLKQTYQKHSVTRDWMGDENEKLVGFTWCYGSQRQTIGILMWSDIFLYDYPNGDKIAIILLDTQGTFDNESSLMESATVFGLSTMISSVMIYNIQHKFDECYLQHLHLFTEYGRLALTASNDKPFQNLWFLVRDWNFPDEAAYGCEGGEQTLNKYLRISGTQPPELQTVRRHIKSCFTKVNCFLLPHPGKNVGRRVFDGCLKDLDDEFKQSLRAFVPSILAPETLVSKTMNGELIRVQDLLTYLETYMSVFNSNELPHPKTVLMATAEANYRRAINIAKNLYMDEMTDVRNDQNFYLSANDLELKHLKASILATNHFDQQKKLCGDEMFKKYRNDLIKEIEETYNSIKKRNEEKMINAELSVKVVVNNAHAIYVECMREASDAKKPLLESQLKEYHSNAMEGAFNELKSQLEARAVRTEISRKYKFDLKDKIIKTYEDFLVSNAKKLHNANAECSTAVNRSKKLYSDGMINKRKCYLSANELEVKHSEASNLAINQFDQQKEMFSDDIFNKCRDYLVEDIKDIYNWIIERNEEKKVNINCLIQAELNKALTSYKKYIGIFSVLKKKSLESKVLEKRHLYAKERAYKEFILHLEGLDLKLCEEFHNIFENEINNTYEDFKEFNADMIERNGRLEKLDKSSKEYQEQIAELRRLIKEKQASCVIL